MRTAIQTMLMCAGLPMAACGYVHAGLVTVTSQTAQTHVGTFVPSNDFNSAFYNGTALDGIDHTATAVHDTFGSYSTTANLSEQPLNATLSYQFEGSTAGVGAAALSLAVVTFTANSDNLLYALSGNYSYENASSNPDNITAMFSVYLRDVTASAFAFRNEQAAFATNPVNMTVGGTFEDVVGAPFILEGLLSGTLINGHVYEFSYTADTRYGTIDSSGNVLLSITSETSAVPEPGSLSLFSLGAVGLGFMARRRRAMDMHQPRKHQRGGPA